MVEIRCGTCDKVIPDTLIENEARESGYCSHKCSPCVCGATCPEGVSADDWDRNHAYCAYAESLKRDNDEGGSFLTIGGFRPCSKLHQGNKITI